MRPFFWCIIHSHFFSFSQSFWPPKPKIKEKITRTRRPSDFSLRFLNWNSYISAEFWKVYKRKVVVLSEAVLLVFDLQRPKSRKKITRTPRPSDFSLRFWSWKSYILAEFWRTSLEKVVVLSEAFLLVYDTWWYLNNEYDFLTSKGWN